MNTRGAGVERQAKLESLQEWIVRGWRVENVGKVVGSEAWEWITQIQAKLHLLCCSQSILLVPMILFWCGVFLGICSRFLCSKAVSHRHWILTNLFHLHQDHKENKYLQINGIFGSFYVCALLPALCYIRLLSRCCSFKFKTCQRSLRLSCRGFIPREHPYGGDVCVPTPRGVKARWCLMNETDNRLCNV